MPKYGGGNLPPGMVPGGGGYGSGSGIAGQNAGNYGDYGYDMPSVVRSPMGTNWMTLSGLSSAQKNKYGVGGPGSYATYLSNTGQLNNPNVYVAPGETAFAATPDYTLYEDYKNGKVQFKDGRIGGLGYDLPAGTVVNGTQVADPNGRYNRNYGGSNQQGGPNVAQYPNQQQGPNSIWNSEKFKKFQAQAMASNPNISSQGWGQTQPQTDPYQLPRSPQFSSANGVSMNPGQPQISTVGPQNAEDINPYGGPSVGPRPQQPPLAPGQHPYNGPAIKPMNNQPGKGIGPGGPTVFNQNFAQSPYGQSQMPYQPRRAQWQPPQQGQQWGY